MCVRCSKLWLHGEEAGVGFFDQRCRAIWPGWNPMDTAFPKVIIQWLLCAYLSSEFCTLDEQANRILGGPHT
jgi:hypothetical protein